MKVSFRKHTQEVEFDEERYRYTAFIAAAIKLADIFLLLLNTGRNLYTVVRESCPDDVIKRYHLEGYKIIRA